MNTCISTLGRKVLDFNMVDKGSDYLDNIFSLDKIPNLTDEDKAEELLRKVINENGFILGVTDYDSDGLNSAAVIRKALTGKSDNFDVINNKRSNGNGFNPVLNDRIKRIHDDKPISLIITADHGSSNERSFKELKEYGIKHIIITDHHEIPKDNPPVSVDVFINPQKQEGDPQQMCGCYTVFKVLSTLYKDDNNLYENLYKDCLPHVAIATISDVMDLSIPYNRLVVRAGLQIMNHDDGLWAMLIDKLGLPYKYTYKDIGYKLSPLINTGNRTDKEELIHEMLVATDKEVMEQLVQTAVTLNNERKKVKGALLARTLDSLKGAVIGNSICQIMDSTMAINGVIASSLGEAYKVPVTCFSLDKETNVLAGSVRGILDHIHISNIFNQMAEEDPDLFIKYGGHKGAGGCAINLNKYDRYRELFDKMVAASIIPEDTGAGEFILPINTGMLSYDLVNEIDYYGPYGRGWVMPMFVGKFKVKYVKPLAKLLIGTYITQSGYEISGTYFFKDDADRANIINCINNNKVLDITFEPQYYRRSNTTKYVLMINKIEA